MAKHMKDKYDKSEGAGKDVEDSAPFGRSAKSRKKKGRKHKGRG